MCDKPLFNCAVYVKTTQTEPSNFTKVNYCLQWEYQIILNIFIYPSNTSKWAFSSPNIDGISFQQFTQRCSYWGGGVSHPVFFHNISFIWKPSSWLALGFILYTEDSPSVPYHVFFFSTYPLPWAQKVCFTWPVFSNKNQNKQKKREKRNPDWTMNHS